MPKTIENHSAYGPEDVNVKDLDRTVFRDAIAANRPGEKVTSAWHVSSKDTLDGIRMSAYHPMTDSKQLAVLAPERAEQTNDGPTVLDRVARSITLHVVEQPALQVPVRVETPGAAPTQAQHQQA